MKLLPGTAFLGRESRSWFKKIKYFFLNHLFIKNIFFINECERAVAVTAVGDGNRTKALHPL